MKNGTITAKIPTLKFPLQYLFGAVCDADGNVIIEANRNSNSTPLSPMERDILLKTVCHVLNQIEKPLTTLGELAENGDIPS
jgi:hypothetical protein